MLISEIFFAVGAVISIIMTSIYAALETAITSINVIRFKSLIINNKFSANHLEWKLKKIKFFLKKYSSTIVTIAICNNLFVLIASTLSGLFFTEILNNNAEIGDGVSLGVLTLLLIFLGEAIPKHFSRNHPEKVCVKFLYFLIAAYYILYPIVFLFNSFFKTNIKKIATEKELGSIVKKIREQGLIEEKEKHLILRAIQFDDSTINNYYISKKDCIFVYEDFTFEDIKIFSTTYRYWRLPLINRETGVIIGIINLKSFLVHHIKGENFKLYKQKIIDNVPTVRSSVKLEEALSKIRRTRTKVAFVVNNYYNKQMIGMILLSNIFESLVGEIYSDHYEDLLYRKIGYNRYLVSENCKTKYFFTAVLKTKPPKTNKKTFKLWIRELNFNSDLTVGNVVFYLNYEIRTFYDYKKRRFFEISIIDVTSQEVDILKL